MRFAPPSPLRSDAGMLVAVSDPASRCSSRAAAALSLEVGAGGGRSLLQARASHKEREQERERKRKVKEKAGVYGPVEFKVSRFV